MYHLRILFLGVIAAGLSFFLIACDSGTSIDEQQTAVEGSGTASLTLKRSVNSDVPSSADSAVVLVRNQENLSSEFVRLIELPDKGDEAEVVFDVPSGTYYAYLVAYEYRTPSDPTVNAGPLNPLALGRSIGSFDVQDGDLTRLDLSVEPIEFTLEVVEPFRAGISNTDETGLLRVSTPVKIDSSNFNGTGARRTYEFGRIANWAVSRQQEFDLYDGPNYIVASENAATDSLRRPLPTVSDWRPGSDFLPVEVNRDWYFSFPTNDDPDNTDDVFFKIGVQYFYAIGSIVDDRFLGFNRIYFPNRSGAGFRIPVSDPGGNLIITFRKTADGWTTVQSAAE